MPLVNLKKLKKKFSPTATLGLRKTQSTGDIDDSVLIREHRHQNVNNSSHTSSSTEKSGILRPARQYPERPPTPPLSSSEPGVTTHTNQESSALSKKLSDISAGDLDLLLSIETQTRMDHQEELAERQKKNEERQKVRRSAIRFNIPETPPRPRSPDFVRREDLSNRRWSMPDAHLVRRLARIKGLFSRSESFNTANNHRSSISSGQSSDSCSENSHLDSLIAVGCRVVTLKRPLPIVATVRYVGELQGEQEEWVGLELDAQGN